MSCQQKKKSVETPWGTTVELNDDDSIDTITVSSSGNNSTIDDIRQGGELIMLTITGPSTYYEYHGKGLGENYLLCERFAEYLGVTLRVDICRDTLDMLKRLKNGEGDIVAVPLRGKASKDYLYCTDSWAVSKDNQQLADALKAWYKPKMLEDVRQEEQYILANRITRRTNPLILSASKGTISVYDNLFRKYAPTAQVHWTLLAAQCYQESCFDPQAHSWAGACGLMQIIPTTADHLSLPRKRMYEPEANVSAAARYMKELQEKFNDVRNPEERLKFALASYNGGYHHIRDAMALASKYGHSQYRWAEVRHYILGLSRPAFYNDPVVKNGYMRGSETANYVDMIMQRWSQYQIALKTGKPISNAVPKKSTKPDSYPSPLEVTPHRASKANKWRK